MIFLADMTFKCLIFMILTMTKYHETLLRDSSLSLLWSRAHVVLPSDRDDNHDSDDNDDDDFFLPQKLR